MQKRIEEEKRIAELMIRLYCEKAGHRKVLCPDCRELLEYVLIRLEKCPYGERKNACKRCKTHCYCPEMRTKIRKVMRFSGPRMLLYAPLEVLRHWLKK